MGKISKVWRVFRNKNNKWFAVILNVDKSKVINNEYGEIEIINVKLDDLVNKYQKKRDMLWHII